ncbi:quinolinate synthase NadA [Clostridium chrysemydis]|uniref:quinolinate synthase NadA n=2 Tax=Clostridium TaxID=1485 RepID=UPI001883B0F8|nr:quinolinate synthase NadA [Clostridium chrysemydis]
MDNITNQILKLKDENDILILAHYYVSPEIQKISDFVGDSYYLSKIALERPEKTIVFCGVSFMGESAKILSPNKTIILPNLDSKCPMADMISIEEIKTMREKYSDLAVVTYINSTSEVKEYADVCVTSSNAIKVIPNLKEKNIFFVPDRNLGSYLKEQIKDKNFILNNGFCPIHNYMNEEDVLNAKKLHPKAKVISHPECTKEVLNLSDFIGSTSEIIEFATKDPSLEFIVCTEVGVFYELKKNNPNKKFYTVNDMQICPNMKKITLNSLYDAIKNKTNTVHLSENIILKAKDSLTRMHELAK